jgi:hypothetical protein
MPDVQMFWAQTSWSSSGSSGAPPLKVNPVPSGLDVSQRLRPSGSAWTLRYDLFVTATYWLGTDRMPAAGFNWRSHASDKTTGAVIGQTGSGYWPFGPWPSVFAGGRRTQRIFSGSQKIVDAVRGFSLINYEDENKVEWRDVPESGTFPLFHDYAFNFTRTQNLGIELGLWLLLSLSGDTGSLELRNMIISFPQFIIRGEE